MEKGLEEHNPMEAVVQDLLIYLRHQQTEVRKKALEALFAYSGDPTVQRAIQHQDFVKAIKACLYDVKLVHTTLLLLLNASAEKDIVKAFEEVNIIESLMQIMVNVMKTMNKEDLILKKHLMVEVGDTKIGPGGDLIRELKVNSGEKLSQDEVVAVMNIENLRLALLIISNMCILSLDSKRQILQLNHPDPKVHGTHFIVLLGWFLIDEYELLFESFSSLVNSLSEGDDFKEFLLGKTIRLETRIKRYVLHENNVIRSNIMMCMKNLFFAYENTELTERFCEFKEDEVHVIELVCRALYIAIKKKYQVKESHIEIMDNIFGKIWKPIKTLKQNNPKLLTVELEIEHCLDILLVSTNFEWSKFFPDGMEHFDQVKQLRKTVAMYLEYGKEGYLRDKVTAIAHIYTNEMLM